MMGKKMTRQEIKAGRAQMKKAQAALDRNAAREKRRGIRDETVTYRRLNRAVNDAVVKLPWWAR